jgi:hypothetical protein
VVRLQESSALEQRLHVKEEIINEGKNDEIEILDEYDFSNAVIGKYAKQYAEGTNIVVLEPDVAHFARFLLKNWRG